MSSEADDSAAASALLEAELQRLIAGKAMPLGALGGLEDLARQIGLAFHTSAPRLKDAALIVFAGDHGITAEGVTAYPSTITLEIARLIAGGRAGANVCANASGIPVTIVDAGLLQPLDAGPRVLSRRVGVGTRNARREAAMTTADYDTALAAGGGIVEDFTQDGVNVFAFGEVGIGNSSAAALVAHALTGIELSVLAGPGAGLPPGGIAHKITVLKDAYARAPVRDATAALQQFAGFEMVMMAGAMIAAARHGLVIVDGYIATVVALAAVTLEPDSCSAMIFSHLSAEPGHRLILECLGAKPLFDLGLRLGEGTGAALAVPFVRAAAGILTDLADLPGARPE